MSLPGHTTVGHTTLFVSWLLHWKLLLLSGGNRRGWGPAALQGSLEQKKSPRADAGWGSGFRAENISDNLPTQAGFGAKSRPDPWYEPGASSVAQGGTGGSPERLGPLSKSTAASPGLAVHFSRHWPLPSPHQPEYRNAQHFPVRRASLHPTVVADVRSHPISRLPASSQPT